MPALHSLCLIKSHKSGEIVLTDLEWCNLTSKSILELSMTVLVEQ